MKASIIIRAYNAEVTIERAVLSALAQKFPLEDFEAVVVNDGSTDGTLTVLDAFTANPQVRVISQKNKGLAGAANTGVRNSEGQYVTFLDSDDEFLPSLLAELVPLLDANPALDFAYPDYFEEFNGVQSLVSPKTIFDNVMIGVLFRRANLIAEGMYRNIPMFSEYDLFLRTFGKWKGQHVSKPLFTYCRRKGSVTSEASHVKDALQELERLHPDKVELVRSIRGYEF